MKHQSKEISPNVLHKAGVFYFANCTLSGSSRLNSTRLAFSIDQCVFGWSNYLSHSSGELRLCDLVMRGYLRIVIGNKSMNASRAVSKRFRKTT